MSDQTVLLTGATGFLGMELLVRLAEREDREVIALVRAPDRGGAAERLRSVAERLGVPIGAVTALAADLQRPDLGLGARERAELRRRVDSVIHCAASVSFDLPLEEARAINTRGAERVLGLCRALSLRRVVQVSTAYVSGRRPGPFHEHELAVGQEFRNSYEQSKHEAELAAARHAEELPLVIARPSIVVGDSRTGWTPAFNVVYWPLRAYARGLLDDIPADPDGLVDIVPVDYVADGILALHDRKDATGTYALVAGASAPSNERVMAMASVELDRPPPRLGVTDAQTIAQASVYLPYFDVHTVFDDRRAREALAPLRAPLIEEYFPAMLGYATATYWGKRPLPRAQAPVVQPGGRR
ncbi:MAG TPA: SDR family oxidoreductase [Solirubrobacteraceae bacterium]|nr:SDR family oxidoreductase [Solirubrobacteraceae bacterium]